MTIEERAAAIVQASTGPERLQSHEQCTNAGLDPDVMEAVVRHLLGQLDPGESFIFSNTPGLSIMLGITLAATAVKLED